MTRHLSISQRLMISATLLLAVLMPLAGWLLTASFQRSVNHSYDNRLGAQVNVVVAALQEDDFGRLELSRSLGDERFEQIFSGWYWQVADDQQVLLLSRSLWDERLQIAHAKHIDDVLHRDGIGPREQPIRLVERDIRLPGRPGILHVSLAGPRDDIDREVASFTWLVVKALGAIALTWLIMLAIQIRWGLRPLRKLTNDVRDIKLGRRSRLRHALPPELAVVAEEVNHVLDRDSRLIERGRSAAGNLAHAIKTPLAIIRAQISAFDPDQASRIRPQLDRLDTALRHHLSRASAAGQPLHGAQIELQPVLMPVLQGIQRLAERRGLQLETDIQEGLRCRMDAQDAQELIGNLLDNALKFAASRLRLSARNADGHLQICCEDDGPGMQPDAIAQALQRGTKLDEQRSEFGLGLSIVKDLANLYNAELDLDRSALGGLRVTLRFKL
jgi:signal transduction histidine kinase